MTRWLGTVFVSAAGTASLAGESLTVTPESVRLSDRVRLEVSIEGAAPLRVEPPARWLAPASAADWRITPAGPATLDPVPGGRERWRQPLWAEPYRPGGPQRLELASIGVTEPGRPPRTVAGLAADLTVTTTVGDAAEGAARPVTGVEPLPGGASDSPNLASVGVPVALGICGAVWAGRRIRQRWFGPSPTRPVEPIHVLDGTGPEVPPRELAERIVTAVRLSATGRVEGPVARLTAAELSAAFADPTTARVVLDRCDAIRFGGELPTAGECDQLLAHARTLIGSPPFPQNLGPASAG